MDPKLTMLFLLISTIAAGRALKGLFWLRRVWPHARRAKFSAFEVIDQRHGVGLPIPH